MTPPIAIIKTLGDDSRSPNQRRTDLFKFGHFYSIKHDESGSSTSAPQERRHMVMVREDLPWNALPTLADAGAWTGTSFPAAFKEAFPRELLVTRNDSDPNGGPKTLASRFGFSMAAIGVQLMQYLDFTTNSCGTITDGGRCGLIYNDGAFHELTKWLPTVDEYPDIYKPGYFSGCLAPGERELLNSFPESAPPGESNKTFNDFINEGRGRPPVDSAGMAMTAENLSAVPVSPWWDPSQTVYVCPGLAVDVAVKKMSSLSRRFLKREVLTSTLITK